MAWTSRPATADDHGAVRTLFADVFGYQRKAAHDRWLSFDGPDGPIIATVAEDAGSIVGYYALLPTALRLGKEVVAGAQSLDTMTHPDYRGQGMFTRLAIATFDLAADRGVKALYGFPNAASYPGFVRKLNWDHVRDIPRWTRVLSPSRLTSMPRPLARVADRFSRALTPAASERGIAEGMPTEESLEELLERLHGGSPKGSCSVDRSVSWMKWRFSQDSGRAYRWIHTTGQAEGFAVAVWGIREDGHGVLSDVLGFTQDAIDIVVRHAVHQALEAGVPALHSVTNRPMIVKALRRAKFVPRKPLPLITRSMTHENLDGNIHDPESWLVSAADIDTY